MVNVKALSEKYTSGNKEPNDGLLSHIAKTLGSMSCSMEKKKESYKGHYLVLPPGHLACQIM